MHRLTPQEKVELDLLSTKKQQQFKMPPIAMFVYLFGGLLGWISLVLFLNLLGFDLVLMGILGLCLMATALYLDKKSTLDPLFILSLMLVGHLHLVIALQEGVHLELYTLVFIETFFTLIAFLLFSSVTYRYLQAFLYCIIIFMLPIEYGLSPYLHYLFLIISILLLIYLWLQPHPKLLLLREVLMITQSIYLFALISNLWGSSLWDFKLYEASYLLRVEALNTVLLSLIFAVTLLLLYPTLRRNIFVYLGLISLAFISWFTSMGIVLSFLYLLLSTYTHEKKLRYLSLVLGSSFIYFFYHSLQLPLDQKGLLLMLSGFVLVLLSWILRTPAKEKHV